jgi:hypothetical protein
MYIGFQPAWDPINHDLYCNQAEQVQIPYPLIQKDDVLAAKFGWIFDQAPIIELDSHHTHVVCIYIFCRRLYERILAIH